MTAFAHRLYSTACILVTNHQPQSYSCSCPSLPVQGAKFEIASARLENREAVIADIEKAKPTHVLNCAGITGRPNVDWCEDHKARSLPCLCVTVQMHCNNSSCNMPPHMPTTAPTGHQCKLILRLASDPNPACTIACIARSAS